MAISVEDHRLPRISSSIRVIPNFPKPGVMFQDITTLLLDPKAFRDTIDMFVERYKDQGITVVAGVEARGFIFGPPIALDIGAKFVPLRKPKKLPGEVISEEYTLEYGTDKMEMHVGAVQPGDRVLVIDDLIATGGTLCAAIKLLEWWQKHSYDFCQYSGAIKKLEKAYLKLQPRLHFKVSMAHDKDQKE